jgi:hypothetical protein
MPLRPNASSHSFVTSSLQASSLWSSVIHAPKSDKVNIAFRILTTLGLPVRVFVEQFQTATSAAAKVLTDTAFTTCFGAIRSMRLHHHQ